MRFTAVTLFPQMFDVIRAEGVIARGIEKGRLSLDTVQMREFSKDERRNVDDRPVGGGDGMVLRPDIVGDAIESVLTQNSYVIHLTPAGKVFSRQCAIDLASRSHLIFLCGRYAGFDERVVARYAHIHLSIGDFVISGGELAALCIMDSVARYLPGVLGNETSARSDSFEDGLLEAAAYTKPLEYGAGVPEVLLSGDHKKIQKYTREQQIVRTASRRPDLILKVWDTLSKAEKALAETAFRSGTKT